MGPIPGSGRSPGEGNGNHSSIHACSLGLRGRAWHPHLSQAQHSSGAPLTFFPLLLNALLPPLKLGLKLDPPCSGSSQEFPAHSVSSHLQWPVSDWTSLSEAPPGQPFWRTYQRFYFKLSVPRKYTHPWWVRAGKLAIQKQETCSNPSLVRMGQADILTPCKWKCQRDGNGRAPRPVTWGDHGVFTTEKVWDKPLYLWDASATSVGNSHSSQVSFRFVKQVSQYSVLLNSLLPGWQFILFMMTIIS